MTPEQSQINARIAAISKNRPADTETIDALKRELKASRLADHIKQVVASAPPLTAEQRDQLAVLLRVA